MNRSEFLKQLGAGAAFALTATCLGGCATDNVTPDQSAQDVDFTLDLTETSNANLLQDGGYIVVNNQVVVGRTTSGSYVAATRLCSHEARKLIRLRNDEWYCTEHGARFSLSGSGLNSDARNGLTIYNVNQDGDFLHVYA